MPKKVTPHLRIRVEPKLLERLEKARGKTGRTLTGEISVRLEESFRTDELFLAQANAMEKFSSELAMELTERIASIVEAIGPDKAQMKSLRAFFTTFRKAKEEGKK